MNDDKISVADKDDSAPSLSHEKYIAQSTLEKVSSFLKRYGVETTG